MAAYYVLGITFVAFALVITAFGLARGDFPPTRTAGRALMAIAGLIAIGTFVMLVTHTHREHPREEANKKAAEQKASPPAGKPPAATGTVAVTEKEYSIALAGATTLKAGKTTFAVKNDGKIQHDLAVEDGKEQKTPLIDSGKSATLAVDLKPGKYKLYCTVPGHEQLGMKQAVTVR
jgi:plastocyanin